MDYEKKYKEALERAKAVLEIAANKEEAEGYVSTIFPELKESEDERIRKKIIDYFRGSVGLGVAIGGVSVKDMVSWLEKQGKQKSIWHNEDEEPQRDSLILLIMQSGTPIVAKIIEPNHTFNHGERWAYIDDLLEKQDEQKLTIEMKSAEESLGIDSETYNKIVDECIYGEQKSQRMVSAEAKEAMYDKPACAWSEKDENVLEDIKEAIINYWGGDTQDILLDWLKSLKQRYTWKPSLAQMNALSIVSKGNAPDDMEAIVSLYNDLKKLREE